MAFDVRAVKLGGSRHLGARPARYLPIGEHRLMGDLRTVALVGTDGTIDWYCCSRFDSPSVFARAAEMRVLRGRALPAATSGPFSPLAEALFSAFRDGPPADLTRLGPRRAGSVPGVPSLGRRVRQGSRQVLSPKEAATSCSYPG